MLTEAKLPKIESREAALKSIKEVSTAFLLLAAVQGIFGASLPDVFGSPVMPAMLIDACIYGVLALLLRFLQSRIAACILVLIASVGVVTTVLSSFGIAHLGGTNILLAVIVLWVAIQGVRAAFAFHNLSPPPLPARNPLGTSTSL